MIVADVNLIAYLLIAGPQSAASQRTWDRDGVWLAPDLWRDELLNVLATSVRNRLMTADAARAVWTHAPSFVRDADVSPLDVLALATQTGFATYDCYYVVLARTLNARLVTADRRLLAEFGDVAVSIVDFADGL